MGILLQINPLLQEQSAGCQVRLGLCSRIITACSIAAVSRGRRKRLAASTRIHSESWGRGIGCLSTMPHRNNPYGEANLQASSSANRASASAITELREYPLPFAISRSPRARSRNNSRFGRIRGGIFAINAPPVKRLTTLPMDFPVNPYAL
jgi:hypothetical protein